MSHVSEDLRTIDVEMPLTPLNRNYVGTQFGGSLYSMCDPFFMMILLLNLGDAYVVWDKAASIQFLRPGRSRVRARFQVSPEQLAAIRAEADQVGKSEPQFEVDITDEAGEIIARVQKTVHVRRKDRVRRSDPLPRSA